VTARNKERTLRKNTNRNKNKKGNLKNQIQDDGRF